LEYALNSSTASAANGAAPNSSIAPGRSVASEALGRAKAAAGNATALAHKLGVTRQALSQWAVVPVLRILDVERITGIPRHELRPDMHDPPIFQRAESAPAVPSKFTNQGETAAGQQRQLTRVAFETSRLMEFCTTRELTNQVGHDPTRWPEVVVKELVDNALDAAEEADIAPVIWIDISGDTITITDNGAGVPDETVVGVLDYTTRTSNKEVYSAPTRGAQGNWRWHSRSTASVERRSSSLVASSTASSSASTRSYCNRRSITSAPLSRSRPGRRLR
jgi:DNA-binding transcriptional regulator YdaS (Cro superfamily)